MAARKDGKGRALRKGESYRKSEGRTRYSYCYADPFGKGSIFIPITWQLLEKEKNSL